MVGSGDPRISVWIGIAITFVIAVVSFIVLFRGVL